MCNVGAGRGVPSPEGSRAASVRCLAFKKFREKISPYDLDLLRPRLLDE